jgi:hypothetical protein
LGCETTSLRVSQLGPARFAFDLAQGDYVSKHPNVKSPSLREERYDWRTK